MDTNQSQGVNDRIEQCTFDVPVDLHPETKALIRVFASAMAAKLRKAELKYGYENSWQDPHCVEGLQQSLLAHISKGDPLDVANYCAFLWWHQAATILPEQPKTQVIELEPVQVSIGDQTLFNELSEIKGALLKAGCPITHDDRSLMSSVEQIEWLSQQAKA